MRRHKRRGHNNLAFLLAASLVCLLALPGIASAQFTTDTPTQAELLKLPEAEQSTRLAEVVRRTQQNRKCARARVSLEKTVDNGPGGWLVQCEEGQDYWVMTPVEAKKAAIALPCILARATAQVDCYANFRTTQPDSVKQCMQSPFPDRMISACTAIIQSGRLAEKPEALAFTYDARAKAFSQYRQFDLALSDFDRAVALHPNDKDVLFNRAVTFERKGDFDSAMQDLNEVLRSKPDHALARHERGYVYLQKKDYDRAIEDLNQAVRLKPDNAKAYRDRGQAYRAKGEPAKADADQQKAGELDSSIGRPAPQAALPAQASPPQNTPAPAKSELSEADKQAAYCMEASFGYARQHTGLVSLLRENLKAVEALREKPGLSPADRAQIDARLKSTNDNIAANDATGKRWNGHVLVFMDYLKRRGLLQGAGPSLIAQVSQEVSKDQQAVAETYSSCLRLCKPDSAPCKNACNDKAESSEPRKRMQRCEQIVTSFK
jgi:tetratricopeptide (TPR) repeat protein